jgi:anthranilate synthase component II
LQRILLLDNFDSFTFNLAHYLENAGAMVDVVRCGEIFAPLAYDKIVFSPGPGLPADRKEMFDIIEIVNGKRPIFGVCLGMQAIALHLGGEIYNQETVKHGMQEKIRLLSSDLFDQLPDEIKVGLYHSWAVQKNSGSFSEIAFSENDILMAIENVDQKLFGVQFHPESIMTPKGRVIIENFLKME